MRLLVGIALPLLLARVTVSAAESPNFLVILADDLGYSDLGCYGGEIATPHLDDLAANGIRYTQFYNTARCWPTRGSLMTGYYAQQIRRDALPDSRHRGHGQRPVWARLIPQLLRGAGYRSYHSGKWHIDGRPLDGGFDRSYRVNDHDRHFNPQKHVLDGRPLPAEPKSGDYYSSTAITDQAIKFLKEHAEQHGDRPFFEFIAFISPHFPLHAPPSDIAKYSAAYQCGWDTVRAERWQRIQRVLGISGRLSALEPSIGPPYYFPQALKKLGAGEVDRELDWPALTPVQQDFQAQKMAIHAAMVHAIDREVGRVVDELRRVHMLEDTVIFFLSDNGASAEIMVRGDGHDPSAAPGSASSYLCLGPGWSRAANTPFRRHKTWVHEGGIATPLIVHWPAGFTAAGEIRYDVGHVIDIAPTLVSLAGTSWSAEAAGTPVPPSPGRELTPTFAADRKPNERELWWLHEGNRAVRVGDWKLVAARDQPWELFDLAVDRCETSDLAKYQPDRVLQLAAVWDRMTKEFQELANASVAKP